MIHENCINFEWEWVIDLQSTILYGKTEAWVRANFYNNLTIFDMAIEDCEKTGVVLCNMGKLDAEDECPKNCPRLEVLG